VIIVAGTSAAQPLADVFYAPLAARLRSDGYEPFIFGLPGGGLQDIATTSQALSDFADDVMGSTGSDTVSLVGHSQGGLVGRHYIRFLGGADNVAHMVSLGAPQYGTSLANLATWFGLGNCLGITACEQMAIGSSFLADLNAGDDSFGPVQYTNIATKLDAIVTPYRTAFLDSDANNTNVAVQDRCWARLVGHVTLATDGAVYSGIRQALEGRDSIRLSCWAV
jgi:triacylglycerol esterase/lipase EstA (alpha/beta hydrolase family)